MSAYADNIVENLRKTDPEFSKAMDAVIEGVEEYYKALGVTPPPGLRSGIIIKTEDMTDEEIEMQCIEHLLKRGRTLEEAESEAKKYLIKVSDIFDELDAMTEIKKERLLQ